MERADMVRSERVVVRQYTNQVKTVQCSRPKGICLGQLVVPTLFGTAATQSAGVRKGWTSVRLAVSSYGTNISQRRVCFGAVIGKP